MGILIGVFLVIWVFMSLFSKAKDDVDKTVEEVKKELGDKFNPPSETDRQKAAGWIVIIFAIALFGVIAFIGSLAPAGLLVPR